MNRAEIIEGLRGLTHKQFVELFCEAVQGRFIYDGEEMLWDSHLVLANGVRDRTEPGSTWTLELLCPTPGQTWGGRHLDLPARQPLRHRDHERSKQSLCSPFCGETAYGT